MSIEFQTDEAKELAIFLAQLVREGAGFTVLSIGGGWRVTLTGGF